MEPKTALAGGILEIFSARFRDSMAVFNAEMVPSCPLGRWDSAFLVGTRGRTMGYGGCAEGLFAVGHQKNYVSAPIAPGALISGIDTQMLSSERAEKILTSWLHEILSIFSLVF